MLDVHSSQFWLDLLPAVSAGTPASQLSPTLPRASLLDGTRVAGGLGWARTSGDRPGCPGLPPAQLHHLQRQRPHSGFGQPFPGTDYPHSKNGFSSVKVSHFSHTHSAIQQNNALYDEKY